MKDNNNIENLFKDAFESFEPNVDASVWNGVEQGIKNIPVAPASTVVKSFSVLKSVIAVVSVATIAVVTYSILKTKSPKAIVEPVSNTQTTIGQTNFNANEKINSESENNSNSSQTLSVPKAKQISQPKIESSETVASENSNLPNTQSSTSENSNVAANTLQSNSAQPLASQQKQMQAEQKPEQASSELPDTKENPISTPSQTCELNLSNTFTPNGDGFNDTYFVEDNNLAELHVKILDLRGNILKQWNNTTGLWDGKLASNAEAPNGNYLLIVNAVCKNGEAFSKKIQIRLIRQ